MNLDDETKVAAVARVLSGEDDGPDGDGAVDGVDAPDDGADGPAPADGADDPGDTGD